MRRDNGAAGDTWFFRVAGASLPPRRLTLLLFPGRIRRLSRASPAAVPFLSPHPEL